MKTKLLISVLLWLITLSSLGQNIIYFQQCNILDSIRKQRSKSVVSTARISLWRNDSSYVRPTAKYSINFDQEGQKRLSADCSKLLQQEFPNVSNDDYEYLKKIVGYVWIFPNGSCRFDYFSVPELTINHFPDLEFHLVNLIKEIELMDFRSYGMVFTDPEYKDKSLGYYIFPILWLKKKTE